MYESSSLQRRVRDLRVAAQHVAVHPRQYIMAGLGSDPGRASGGRPCRTATAARQSLRKKKWSNAWSPGPRLGPWTTIWAGAHTRERTRVGNDHRRRRWRAPRRRRGRHRKVSRRREVLLARHLRPGRNRGCGPSRPGRARQRRHRLGAAVRANRPNANRAGPPPRRDLDRGQVGSGRRRSAAGRTTACPCQTEICSSSSTKRCSTIWRTVSSRSGCSTIRSSRTLSASQRSRCRTTATMSRSAAISARTISTRTGPARFKARG